MREIIQRERSLADSERFNVSRNLIKDESVCVYVCDMLVRSSQKAHEVKCV